MSVEGQKFSHILISFVAVRTSSMIWRQRDRLILVFMPTAIMSSSVGWLL